MAADNTIIFISGPTAVGKSDVALRLAKMRGGEIVSCDAMQVYREVPVATNAPSCAVRQEVPHHLVGCVSVTEDYDVVRYRQAALAAIKTIYENSRSPIIVGGTAMYMQVLLDGIFDAPDADPQIRQQLTDQLKNDGNIILHKRLKEVDPAAAEKIHVNDAKRIIRALEVFMTTGRPISALQPHREGLWTEYPVKVIILDMPRERLYARINCRVEEMVQNGLVDEVRGIKKAALSRTAKSVIGVPEILGYLNGEYPLEEAVEKMKQHTRQFAKRQLTWFRRDARFQWVEIQENETADGVCQRVQQIILEKRSM